MVGGVAGGATAGTAFGSAAPTFIPVPGLPVVGTAAAVGAAGGQAIEARNPLQSKPSLIVIPMQGNATDGTGASRALPGPEASVTTVSNR